MRESFNRLVDWLRRDRLERELADELRFHREHAERDARSAGLTPVEASYAAQRRFGNTTIAVEEARDRWSLPRLDQLQQDVRYALRGLRRSPGFTATAILTLALGIGANVAMFSVVDQLMFKPFPFLRDPDSVHRLYMSRTFNGQKINGVCDEYTCYLDMRRFTTSFSQIAAFSQRSLAVGIGDAARERRVATVSGSFWEFFDARPVVGRYFTPTEDVPPRGAEVAVISYSYWQSEFAGASDVIGRRLQVGEIPTTIIGVAPQGFTGVFDAAPAIYIPITLYAGSQRGEDGKTYYTRYNWGWMRTMARRKPDVSVATANADVAQAIRKSYVLYMQSDGLAPDFASHQPTAITGPIKEAAGPAAGLESKTALWVTGVAMIVLLIACANVANLSLARAFRRQREIAVRLALGVSRARLTRQMLLESMLLALLGGVAGVVVAHWGSVAIQRLLVTATDVTRPAVTDWRMLGLVTALVMGAGLLGGVAPAVLSGRGDLAATLRGGARGGVGNRSRLRGALLVTQGALSVVLLIGAGLFVLSLQHVKQFRLCYDPENVLFVGTSLRGLQLDSAGRMAMRRDLLARAQATPGVQSAAIATSIPFFSTSTTQFFVSGIDSVHKLGRFSYQVTTPDFFRTFGTRILRGRGFTESDREALVAVVSESMGKVLWPGKDALGQCLRMRKADAPCTMVVGITEDIVQQQSQLTDGKRYSYYLPLGRLVQPQASTYVLVKTSMDAEAQIEAVRRSLQAVMPGPSYVNVRPMSEVVGSVQRSWRLGANLFVVFGVLALVVAAIGLYGVIAYDVTQRMHELGVRVALGAQAGDVLGLIMGRGARFALAGIVVGSALALAGSKWIEPLLFRQSARDPLVYGAVGALMLLVALAACASPARRAAGADPNTALRSE
jgi:putative ABC transport system permease protein